MLPGESGIDDLRTREPLLKSNAMEFTLLIVEDFLKHHQFVHSIHALKLDLENRKQTHPSADVWMHMYDRCRPMLAPLRQQNPELSIAECIVEFLLHFQETYESKLSSQAAINVLISSPAPKKAALKKSFSLKDAFHAVQSPLKRPSQNKPKEPSPTPPVPAFVSTNQEQHEQLPNNGLWDRSSSVASLGSKKGREKLRLKFMEIPPPTPDSMNRGTEGDHTGPLPKMKMDNTDWKRTNTTIKSVERGMREMRFEANFKGKVDKTIAKILPAALGTSKVDESTYSRELEKERYGMTKRRDCGLCQMPYLMINLPAKVSFRCIMELYARWQYTPPDKDNNSKYRAPKCYDEVPICRFCEQIVQDVTWDPSFEKSYKPILSTTSSATTHILKGSDDPYSLPPLLPEDYLSSGDDSSGEEIQEPKTNMIVQDTPAKTVYKDANYLSGEKSLSLTEWAVLDTDKSGIRRVMERTANRARRCRRNSEQ